MGMGVSGGEEVTPPPTHTSTLSAAQGARHGPALMPGGPIVAYEVPAPRCSHGVPTVCVCVCVCAARPSHPGTDRCEGARGHCMLCLRGGCVCCSAIRARVSLECAVELGPVRDPHRPW